VGRALVVLVVLGALAGTTAWGFANRSSAQDWKERSEASDADLERALARVESTSAEVDDARQRLRDLAAEKAGETDQNRILSEIVAAAPEVTAGMRDCQQETTALANDLIALIGTPQPDVQALQDRVDDVNRVCADALQAAADLESAIDELGI
jgi:chromosome segregation ATPase